MLHLIQEDQDNVFDLNDARRIRNMEKGIKSFEIQLADLKKATAILAKHSEFRFFSIVCHELTGKQKELAAELLKLRIRLDKYKANFNKEPTNE